MFSLGQPTEINIYICIGQSVYSLLDIIFIQLNSCSHHFLLKAFQITLITFPDCHSIFAVSCLSIFLSNNLQKYHFSSFKCLLKPRSFVCSSVRPSARPRVHCALNQITMLFEQILHIVYAQFLTVYECCRVTKMLIEQEMSV